MSTTPSPLKFTARWFGKYEYFEEVHKDCRIEYFPDQRRLNVSDDDGRCEAFRVVEGQLESVGGEYLTEDWSDEDWQAVESAVKAVDVKLTTA